MTFQLALLVIGFVFLAAAIFGGVRLAWKDNKVDLPKIPSAMRWIAGGLGLIFMLLALHDYGIFYKISDAFEEMKTAPRRTAAAQISDSETQINGEDVTTQTTTIDNNPIAQTTTVSESNALCTTESVDFSVSRLLGRSRDSASYTPVEQANIREACVDARDGNEKTWKFIYDAPGFNKRVTCRCA